MPCPILQVLPPCYAGWRAMSSPVGGSLWLTANGKRQPTTGHAPAPFHCLSPTGWLGAWRPGSWWMFKSPMGRYTWCPVCATTDRPALPREAAGNLFGGVFRKLFSGPLYFRTIHGIMQKTEHTIVISFTWRNTPWSLNCTHHIRPPAISPRPLKSWSGACNWGWRSKPFWASLAPEKPSPWPMSSLS